MGTIIVETSRGIGPSRGSAHRSAHGRTRPSAGFTLTELLVVILIVAVLATVVIAITRQVMAKARQAGCVTVLKQVGIATAAHIQDKNDSMPGPINANGQFPNYTTNGKTLFSKLAPYLGLEEKKGAIGLPDTLVCPAFRNAFPGWNANGRGDRGGSLGAPGGSGRVYLLNQDLKLAGKRVFGPQDDEQAATQPDTMKYSVVLDGAPNTPISKIVMLRDYEPTMHGKFMNHLFLDFHVETLPSSHPMIARF